MKAIYISPLNLSLSEFESKMINADIETVQYSHYNLVQSYGWGSDYRNYLLITDKILSNAGYIKKGFADGFNIK